MRRTLQNMKKSESEVLAQDFVSGFFINDGRGMLEASWAMDESSFLWIWSGPNSFSSICGMGGLLSGLLPQVSQPKWNSKAEPWGRVKGQPKLWLKIVARGMAGPICCLFIQPLRGLT